MKQLVKYVVLGVALVLVTPSAHAAKGANPTNAAELIAAVKSAYTGATSLRADFTQVVRIANPPPNTAAPTPLTGRLELERPKRMRIDTLVAEPAAPGARPGAKPTYTTQSVISDGSKLWIYQPPSKDRAATLTELPVNGGASYASLLDDLTRLDDLFVVQMAGDGPSKGAYTLKLTPKTAGAVKSLELQLSKRTYTLERLVVTDPLGNVTEMKFNGVKMNQDIPDSEFAPPAGVKAGP